jgi:hypothetical protein
MADEISAGLLQPPRSPSGLGVAMLDANTVSLTWTPRTSQTQPISQQQVDRWDNVTNTWTKVADLGDSRAQYTTGVAANRRYQFRVFGKNSAGWGTPGYFQYIQTAPAAPGGASAARSGPDSIIVNWANGASTNGYSYVTALEEQVNGGGWTQIAVLNGGVASYLRGGRTPGAVYAYRMRAMATDVGPGGYSGYSTSNTVQIQTVPAAPVAVSTVRSNDNSFTLNWTNRPDAAAAPYDSLTVQRWDNVTATWSTIATLPPTTTSLTDTSTVVDRIYTWRIAATNAVGSSGWGAFTTYQTRPADPTEVKTQAAPGGALKVSWITKASYAPQGDYSTVLRYYKNGALVTSNISLAAGQTSYTLTGVDLTATYKFGVKTVSTVGYTSESAWVDGVDTAAATVPNAPVDLAPNGKAADLALGHVFTWKHNPSLDVSNQTAFSVRYSTDGGTSWTTTAKIVSTESKWTMPKNAALNGKSITWSVQTWGVHATASPWSTPAVFQATTTPTVTINQPAAARLTISRVEVEWSFGDTEGLPQAAWEVELLNASGAQVESQSGSGTTRTTVLNTAVTNGESYTLRVRVTDGDGLQSPWVQKNLNANFIPPAMPTLDADYSQESGSTVLTLTPTTSDGGVTNLPATAVDIQRRLLDPATGTFGEWETLAASVPPATTLVDTTAPIAADGEYRAVAYSAAPSASFSAPVPPAGQEDRWVYLSGGSNFGQVARLMGNVALRTTTTRDRALYSFAGRKKPVMFAGEAVTRIIDVAGLLDGESSSPAEWEELIASSDVLLFRDPLGHRVFGSVPQVAIDYLGNEMYAISFTVTEVSYP